MIAAIQPTNLYAMVARLGGVEPVLTVGKPELITSRAGFSLLVSFFDGFWRFVIYRCVQQDWRG